MEVKELANHNRLALIKMIKDLEEKNKILENAISVALDKIDELKKELGQEADEYNWQLRQQNEREHIS